MSNTVIQLKNSTVTGNVPSSLANGEISINNRDGKFFYSTPAGVVITHYPYLGPAGLNQEVQFNDSGVLGSDSGLTYNKTTDVLTVTGGVVAGGINLGSQIATVYSLANGTAVVANTDYTTVSATAGTYGNATYHPVVTLTANGRVSSITNTAISITTAQVSGLATSATTDTTNASNITTGTLGAARLPTVGTAGTYGNAAYVPVITTDAYGRVTSVTNTAISSSSGATLGDVLALSIALG